MAYPQCVDSNTDKTKVIAFRCHGQGIDEFLS